MEVTRASITTTGNKWTLNIEGTERGKTVKNYIAIPPTKGDRLDIITGSDFEQGYRYDIDGIIIIHILKGFPHVRLYKKGIPF